MSLGTRYYIGEILVNDTAELYAALREREGVVPAEDITGVTFTVQKPNGEILDPIDGEIEDDGQGYLQYTETEEIGQYLVKATFTLLNNEVRSVMVNFVVEDPFDLTALPEEIVVEEVWLRIEDAFDSVEGGPALRDWTLNHFDKNKIARFIPEVLLDINVQSPLTEVGLEEFTIPVGPNQPNPVLPLIAKGVLCKTIQHLIRSYVEQPVPQGAQIVYEDRTRYAQIWQTVYQSEHEDYYTMVRLWKRGFLNYGRSALLVSSKAGRLFYGANMRSQNIGRSFF